MSRGSLSNVDIGCIVLLTPAWLPVVATIGALWCIGWLARAVYTIFKEAPHD